MASLMGFLKSKAREHKARIAVNDSGIHAFLQPGRCWTGGGHTLTATEPRPADAVCTLIDMMKAGTMACACAECAKLNEKVA